MSWQSLHGRCVRPFYVFLLRCFGWGFGPTDDEAQDLQSLARPLLPGGVAWQHEDENVVFFTYDQEEP